MDLGKILSHMIIQHDLIIKAAKEYNSSMTQRLYKTNSVFVDNMEILLNWAFSKEVQTYLKASELLGTDITAFSVYFNRLKNELYEANKYGSFN